MSEEHYFETYLSISPNLFEIYLFDTKNCKNLYKNELKLNTNINVIDLNILDKFLDENVFKIEKLNGKFLENISLILDSKEITSLNFGIKRKNYNNIINIENLKNLITDAKDLFNKSYQSRKIIHILINRYLVDGQSFSSFTENLNGNHFCLELSFKSISDIYTYEIDKVFEKYQIKVIQYLDANYVKNFFKEENLELSEMGHKIKNGQNFNEVKLISKNLKKSGIFEKFFQLFS